MAMLLPSSGLFGRTSASLGIESFKGRYSALSEAATSNRWLISDAAKPFNDTKDLGCVVVQEEEEEEVVVENVAAVVEKGANIETRTRVDVLVRWASMFKGSAPFFTTIVRCLWREMGEGVDWSLVSLQRK